MGGPVLPGFACGRLVPHPGPEAPCGEQSEWWRRGEVLMFCEWVGVFYPHARAEHAFPTLALRPVLSNDAFGGDWVDTAIGHMGFYGLPRKLAEQFVAKGTAPL